MDFLSAERADDAHPAEILARCACDVVKIFLHISVHRRRDEHYSENYHEHNDYRDDEYQRNLRVYRESHYHCAEHYERTAQKQAQKHICAALNLVYVACHSCYEGRGADFVKLGEAQSLYFFKELTAQSGRSSDGRLRGKILRDKAARKPKKRH